ncbi:MULTISPECIES: winged helix-turn-helix transcriptional regulator [unclassified Enterococcus]|uniref:winged helix-turn-helix transcriptional regulator n=1 Tax=unclassified Enterococcus TaxID=2608891 RepID=UPI001CE0E5A3|nr:MULTISPECIES: helix-turn-helix domain-containing protein [unclassified Enterococcus]MCA5014298.1 helix-turn-helix transcriptional regulator [Enterococcus sp. S23]MCA5017709.1 helix-turn-helix transcriptional regulator [Enterococcus sp. S22(2020)]
MKVRENFTCPLEITHDMIKGKWKPIILWLLRKKPLSLSDLEKTIEGISQKMLLEHLHELIQFEFIEKRSFSGYPLKVEYSLKSPSGPKIVEALSILQSIGIDYMIKNGDKQLLIEKEII